MAISAARYACIPAAAIIAVTLGAASTAAQTTPTDVQVWPSVAVTAAMGNRLELRADGLLQVTDGVSRVSRELARVIVVGRLNDRVAVGGGYTWTSVEDGTGSRSVEHRAVQEIDLRVPLGMNANALVLSSRTRLEERRREQEPAIAFRLRQLTRLDLPMGDRGLRAVVWNEYFHAINETDWSGRSGSRLMLNFVGIHVPVTNRIAIEPGYLNQTDFVPGRNQAHHVVALFITARL
jgi:hypothetical protein